MRTPGPQQAHPVRPTRDAPALCRNDPKDQMGEEGEELKREGRNEHPDKQRPQFAIAARGQRSSNFAFLALFSGLPCLPDWRVGTISAFLSPPP